jgi:hypothetical protein
MITVDFHPLSFVGFTVSVSRKVSPTNVSHQPDVHPALRTGGDWFSPAGFPARCLGIGNVRSAHRMATGMTPKSTPGEASGFPRNH